MKIRVALTEDVAELRKSISDNLNCFDEVQLLYTAENGAELLKKLDKDLPDVVLMDINMPMLNGIKTTEEIRRRWPDLKVIMLTVFDDGDNIFNSILAGANGYILKDAKPSRLLSAIEEVMEGGAPMSPQIASKTLQILRLNNKTIEKEKNDFGLTRRELEILELLSSGENYQQIAEKIFISPKTVRKHIENIYGKLHAHNKVEAISIARKNGILH